MIGYAGSLAEVNVPARRIRKYFEFIAHHSDKPWAMMGEYALLPVSAMLFPVL